MILATFSSHVLAKGVDSEYIEEKGEIKERLRKKEAEESSGKREAVSIRSI